MECPKFPSPNKIEQLKFQPGTFFTLLVGSLLVVDCSLLENLRDVTAQAVEDGSFKWCGLVLLVDTKTLDSSDKLTQMNLSLRSLWSSTMVVLNLGPGAARGRKTGCSRPPPSLTSLI